MNNVEGLRDQDEKFLLQVRTCKQGLKGFRCNPSFARTKSKFTKKIMFGLRVLLPVARIKVRLFDGRKIFPSKGPSSTQQVREYPTQKRLFHANMADKQKRKTEEYDSESDGDSDDEHGLYKERGDSQFWQKKMRTLHRLLDVNKDGVLSFDDFKLLAEKFTNIGHLSQENHDEFISKIKEAWEHQRGTIHPYNVVTTEQFTEDMHHILNDKRLRRKVHEFLPYFFKAVDKDHDGQISVEEFKLFFECLGLSEPDAEISFSAIDLDKDGKLSLKEFVKLGRDYLLSENEKSCSKHFWGPLCES